MEGDKKDLEEQLDQLTAQIGETAFLQFKSTS